MAPYSQKHVKYGTTRLANLDKKRLENLAPNVAPQKLEFPKSTTSHDDYKVTGFPSTSISLKKEVLTLNPNETSPEMVKVPFQYRYKISNISPHSEIHKMRTKYSDHQPNSQISIEKIVDLNGNVRHNKGGDVGNLGPFKGDVFSGHVVQKRYIGKQGFLVDDSLLAGLVCDSRNWVPRDKNRREATTTGQTYQ